MNWKNTVNVAPIAAAPAGDNEHLLAAQLGERISEGKLSARDIDFARSLLSGFHRYGNFSAKQLVYVKRFVSDVPVAPKVDSIDGALAVRLQNALSSGSIAQKDEGFAQSLLAGFAKYGRFSDRQRPYAQKFAALFDDYLASPAPVAAPVAPVKVEIKLPNICSVVNLDKFARFSVGDLSFNLKNDGTLVWVKWQGQICGRIDSVTHVYTASVRHVSGVRREQAEAALIAVEADPVAAAKANGIETGRCSCCSRALTDPTSIEIGIGPICREKLG